MKNSIKVGCSSFNNRFWKGVFYPEDLPTKEWFSFYCQHFNTYEFNGSFYKFPTARVLENWFNKTPDQFLFSIKVHKEITHIKRLVECETLIADFYQIASSALKHKLGPILFQFPPSFKYSEENLERLVQSLDLNFKNVVEFRHESWWNQKVWDVFKSKNIIFCSVNYPNLPETIFDEGSFIYVRLHGKLKLFYSNYADEELIEIKNKIGKKEAFVYFNNTASTAGIVNALTFKNL